MIFKIFYIWEYEFVLPKALTYHVSVLVIINSWLDIINIFSELLKVIFRHFCILKIMLSPRTIMSDCFFFLSFWLYSVFPFSFSLLAGWKDENCLYSQLIFSLCKLNFLKIVPLKMNLLLLQLQSVYAQIISSSRSLIYIC